MGMLSWGGAIVWLKWWAPPSVSGMSTAHSSQKKLLKVSEQDESLGDVPVATCASSAGMCRNLSAVQRQDYTVNPQLLTALCLPAVMLQPFSDFTLIKSHGNDTRLLKSHLTNLCTASQVCVKAEKSSRRRALCSACRQKHSDLWMSVCTHTEPVMAEQLSLLNSLCWPSAAQHPGKLNEQTLLIRGRQVHRLVCASCHLPLWKTQKKTTHSCDNCCRILTSWGASQRQDSMSLGESGRW